MAAIIARSEFKGHGHVYLDGTLSAEAGADGLRRIDGPCRTLAHLLAGRTVLELIAISAAEKPRALRHDRCGPRAQCKECGRTVKANSYAARSLVSA